MSQESLFATRDVYTPRRLNREIRFQLEDGYRDIWIEGEISNLSRPASGHAYFTLKDESAQVRCALFRNRRVTTPLSDGAQVLLRARVSLYEARGEYQLIVEHVEPAGEGLLRRQFEELKKKLAGEGLFAEERKQDLPLYPRHIAIISSATGAAIRDVCSVLARRYPSVRVTLVPSQVQGDQAPKQLVAALQAAQRLRPDVILLTRGGGSLEDLWAFNDESLARAMAECPTPLVSAVGHEVDFTIADFVADVRAPTPSAAAELLVPDQLELIQQFAGAEKRLRRALQSELQRNMQRVDYLLRRLQANHPGQRIRLAREKLEAQRLRITAAWAARHRGFGSRLELAREKLHGNSPAARVEALRLRLAQLSQRPAQLLKARLRILAERLRGSARALNAVSPLAVLDRGYSLTRDETGELLTDAADVQPGQTIQTRLARGQLISEVRSIEPDPTGQHD